MKRWRQWIRDVRLARSAGHSWRYCFYYARASARLRFTRRVSTFG